MLLRDIVALYGRQFDMVLQAVRSHQVKSLQVKFYHVSPRQSKL